MLIYKFESKENPKKCHQISDYILLFHHIINKIVVYLNKSFVTEKRVQLFYTLLKEYKIMGRILNLKKIHQGLIQPFKTKICMTQGCLLSGKSFDK